MLGVILAGGGATRMGGGDKAVKLLGGTRLIDHVIARLAPQVHRLAISGTDDRGTGLACIGDAPGLNGPVAGLYGVADHLTGNLSSQDMARGFVTVPVDAPFLPADLVARLTDDPDRPAYASNGGRAHPTFAYWTLAALVAVRETLPDAPAMMRLADTVKARPIAWPSADPFFNVNTPEDLERAETHLSVLDKKKAADRS